MNKIADLTYERAKELFRYNAESGLLERKLKSGRWKVCGHKPVCQGYGYARVDGNMYYTHRVIWLLVHGEWPEHEIDHIDRNKMNNRIENLRAVTPSENQHNHGLRRDNSTGFTGICFHKAAKKYVAQIWLNGKPNYLGIFSTAEDAFLAYQLAKIEHHPTSPDAKEYLRELTLAG